MFVKKLIIILGVAIFGYILLNTCTSCSTADDTNTCPLEVVETSTFLEVKPLSYKGHRYLWFRTKSGKGFGGVAHDPACPCVK